MSISIITTVLKISLEQAFLGVSVKLLSNVIEDTVAYWRRPPILSQVTISRKHWGPGQVMGIKGGADCKGTDAVSQVSGSPMYNVHSVILL